MSSLASSQTLRPASSTSILDRGIIIHQGASKHWLNQPPLHHQNMALQEATATKLAISTLKKQTKAETVKVSTTLHYFPNNGGPAKKVFYITVNLSTRQPRLHDNMKVIADSGPC